MTRPRANNPSHWDLGYYGYAAYLARQMDDTGEARCAYCTIPLTPENHSLDHVDGDRGPPDPSTTVAACGPCNSSAGSHTKQDHENLAAHLLTIGVDPAEAPARVKRILRLPLPARDDPNTVRLAEEHFGTRLQQEREWAAKRAGRDPETAGTGRTRARRAALANPGDTDAPF